MSYVGLFSLTAVKTEFSNYFKRFCIQSLLRGCLKVLFKLRVYLRQPHFYSVFKGGKQG